MDEERLEGQQPIEPGDGTSPAVLEPTADPEPTEEEPVPESERQRSIAGLLLIALVFILFIIIVLLLVQCVGSQSESSSSGGKRIESLEMQPAPETVSVWIRDTTTIGDVLRRAGVSVRSVTNMEQGRYVIELADGESQGAAVARIAEQTGVNDAGLVYEPTEEPYSR